jgi:hypothetical protein
MRRTVPPLSGISVPQSQLDPALSDALKAVRGDLSSPVARVGLTRLARLNLGRKNLDQSLPVCRDAADSVYLSGRLESARH